MPLFHRKTQPVKYDPRLQQPAVRRSICNGEMTVGFIDRKTGKFTDLMMVDGEKGLADFCRSIGVRLEDVQTIY